MMGDDRTAHRPREILPMMRILPAPPVLSVLAGTANALDTKTFWEQQEHGRGGMEDRGRR